MFNIKYNILVIINIIFGILNTVLLIKLFGVSVYSDAYLLSLSIFEVMCLILLMPISQFMTYYNNLKSQSLKKAHDFYNCALLFSFFIGIILCFSANLMLKPIINIFTLNIDTQRYEVLKNLVFIQTIGLMFYPVNGVNERLLNAEMKFSIPYIFFIIPNIIVVAVQFFMIYTQNENIYYLAYARTIGLFFVSLFGTIYIAKTLIKFKFIKWQNTMKDYISNSIIIQFGNSFWAITIPIIFNNFLVTFPQGFVSYFYYAKKILDIVNNFTIGPSKNILSSKISYLLPKRNYDLIKKDSKNFLVWGSFVFILSAFVAFFIQGPILQIITSNKLNPNELRQISLLFLSLCPWYLVILFGTPYVTINIQAKKAKTLLFTNILFTIVLVLLLPIFHKYVGIYALAISTIIAQITNFLYHRKIAIKIFKNI